MNACAMKYFLSYCLLVLFASCELFVSKEKKTQELVNKEMLEIDWNDIDSYPLFENCDETLTKMVQRECFEQEVLTHCAKNLKDVEFTLLSGADSIIQVDFLVDQEGRISILEIQKDPAIDTQMPNFDQLIEQSLQKMPSLAPALKRGIPVKAKFRIPILLNTGG